jgi:hypothetical protein
MDWALKASQNSTKKEGGKRKTGGGKPCGELDGLGTRSITELVYDPTWALLCKKKKKNALQTKKRASQNSSMIPGGPSCVRKRKQIHHRKKKKEASQNSMIPRGSSCEGKKEKQREGITELVNHFS